MASSRKPCAKRASEQPLDFTDALIYISKVKDRFQGQPYKYNKFIKILHTYQKEMRQEAPRSGRPLTEAEVCSQIAQLFENHDDLFAEFMQCVPDAPSHNSLSSTNHFHP